jgi:membrane protease YdiL (CAAX protease family)
MKRIKSLVREYPLTVYVIFTYLFSWAFLIPCYRILLDAEKGTFPILALIGLIGAYGPSITALIISRICEGPGSIKKRLKKALLWKVQVKWYFFIFLAPVVILTISIIGASILLGFSPGNIDVVAGLKVLFPYILVALPFGPMGEELGWRGYLLPELLKKHTPIAASLILGVIWTFWHIASFGYPGAAIPPVFEVNAWTIFLYLGNILGATLLFTFIYLKTKGSVLVAILFHAAFNASSTIVYTAFPSLVSNVNYRENIYIINLLIVILVGIFLLITNKKRCHPQPKEEPEE